MQRATHRAYFSDLDGMRGILSVVVLLLHLGMNALITRLTAGVLPAGRWQLSVDFFFILSGFVLYFAIERARPSLAAYFAKRVRRLAPMALLTTLAMVALAPTRWSVETIIANVLMVQTFLFVQSVNLPAWSIPCELFFPALALPVIGCLARARTLSIVVLLMVMLIGAALSDLDRMPLLGGYLGRGLFGLGSGIMLGRLHQHLAPTHPRRILALGGFAGCLVLMAVHGRWPWLSGVFPFLAAPTIFLGAQTTSFLSSAPFQAVGRWSYSIYLLHSPMIGLVAATIGPVDKHIPAKLLVIALTLPAAALAYRFIERPLMRGRERPAQTAP